MVGEILEPYCKTIIGVRSGMHKGRWARADGGWRWSPGHNVVTGVDEGASAALSVQVVARKQHAVCE